MLSSRGLGVLLKKIYADLSAGKIEFEKIIIGIGGTGTNDLGIGMACEFGMRLLDNNDRELIPVPLYFMNAEKVRFENPELPFVIEAVVDVTNPLLGSSGAAKTFAGQKGAAAEEIDYLERSFERLLNLLNAKERENSLSGAGGGLAAGLQLFFNAEIKTSRNFIVNDLGINSKNSNFEIVITGEGKFDDQSLFNKGAFVVIDEFRETDAKIFFVCGSSEIDPANEKRIEIVALEEFFKDKEESIEKIEQGLERAAQILAQKFV
jgi:glycerate kinase